MHGFTLENPVAQAFIKSKSVCTSVARKQLETLGGPARSLDAVHQLRADTPATILGMNDETADVAGLPIPASPHRADDPALVDGFENHAAAELRPKIFECFRQRRQAEIVVDRRLALVGEFLQIEDRRRIIDRCKRYQHLRSFSLPGCNHCTSPAPPPAPTILPRGGGA